MVIGCVPEEFYRVHTLEVFFAVTENHVHAVSSCTHMRICVHVGMPLVILT